MPEEPLVLYHVDEKVGVVTLNRASKLNALNPAMKAELMAAFRQADEDPETSVVLLRATGRSFCVGYDIGTSGADPHRTDTLVWHKRMEATFQLELTPWDMKKPVIAQVQGHALGGGCEIAMMCDLTIAADNALFGEPEIRFSQVGPAVVMPWYVGMKKARELLYFGDMIGAEEAKQLGMVNRVVPLDEIEEQGLKYAKRLALISPEALYWTKLSMKRGAEIQGFRNALNAGIDTLTPLYATETEFGKKFNEIAEKDGLGAALKWRGDQFK